MNKGMPLFSAVDFTHGEVKLRQEGRQRKRLLWFIFLFSIPNGFSLYLFILVKLTISARGMMNEAWLVNRILRRGDTRVHSTQSNKSSTSLSTAAAAGNGLKTMMKAFVLDVINSLSTAQGRDDLKKIIIINMLPHVVML